MHPIADRTFVVSRWDDVNHVVHEPELFSNLIGPRNDQILGGSRVGGDDSGPWPLPFTDGAQHRRQRSFCAQVGRAQPAHVVRAADRAPRRRADRRLCRRRRGRVPLGFRGAAAPSGDDGDLRLSGARTSPTSSAGPGVRARWAPSWPHPRSRRPSRSGGFSSATTCGGRSSSGATGRPTTSSPRSSRSRSTATVSSTCPI